MTVVELPLDEAFKAGSELWLLENSCEQYWWQEIDFRSGFLLSHALVPELSRRSKMSYKFLNEKPLNTEQVMQIVQQIELPHIVKQIDQSQTDKNLLLLGSSDHFHNKWILIWPSDFPPRKLIEFVAQLTEKLKFKNARFFFQNETRARQYLPDQKNLNKNSQLNEITWVRSDAGIY